MHAERITSRLRLSAISTADQDAFTAVESALRAQQEPPREPPESSECAHYLTLFAATWARGELGYWTARHQAQVVGFGGVQPKKWNGRECWNLYYRLRPDFWGFGFATELATEAVSAGSEHHPDWPVVAEIMPENGPAIRVAEAVGLVRRTNPGSARYAAFVLEPGQATTGPASRVGA